MLELLKPQNYVRVRYQEEGSELDQAGIYAYCINLDPDADEYVQDIFGKQYSVIDNIDSLPEKLPQLCMALTK